MSKRIYLSDNIHNNIQITTFEKSVISTTIFNRLHNIYQNSTVFLTFPSCRHKRFEHSIGVMKLAGDVYANSILNCTISTLQYYTSRMRSMLESVYIDNELGSKYNFSNLLSNLIPICSIESMYKDIFSNFKKDEFSIHCITFQALRYAALLHDLGHPPYSHIVENSLVKLYSEIGGEISNERTQIFKETFDAYIGLNSGKQLHEEVGFVLIDKIIEEIDDQDFSKEFINFCLCFAKKIIEDDDEFNTKYENLPNALHNLIDGEIDADRFDYVCRDARNSGFRIDNLNYNRFYSNFILLYKKIGDEPKDSFMFCPNEKTIDIIDDFFLRKDQLYSKVIYHHRSNKMGILMENVVYKLSKLFIENKIDENFRNEQYSKSIVDNISGLWIPLNEEFYKSNNIMLIQWDDSWLNNILKKYLNEENVINDKELYDSLIELVSNRKKFNSYIKRIDDFIIINNSFKECISHNIEIINEFISKMDSVVNDYQRLETKKNYDIFQRVLSVKNNLGYILCEFSKKRDTDINNHEILIQWLKVKGGHATNKIMTSCIKRLIHKDIEINSLIINKNNAFVGKINHKENIREFFIYFTRDDYIISYGNVSAVPDFLKRQSCHSVGFHFYTTILLNSTQRIELLNKLGIRLSELFFEELGIFFTNSQDLLLNTSNDKIKTEA